MNNFDINSDNIKITAEVSYDTWAGTWLFDDEIKRLGGDFYLFRGDAETIRDVFYIDKMALADDIDLLLNGEPLCYAGNNLFENKSRILDCSLDKLGDILKYSNVGDVLKVRKGWEVYTTRGYSQGDIAHVIKKEGDSEKYINHLFWDAPIYGNVNICTNNGGFLEEYYWNEIGDDYNFNKSEFIEHIVLCTQHDKNKVRDYLNNMLPNDPQYI